MLLKSKGKILVTGGTGYIGSHAVVELAEAGYAPVIVDNFVNSSELVLFGIQDILQAKIPCYQIDCTNEKALEQVFEVEQTIEAVIHFAAYKAVGESVKEPLKYYSNNVGSLITLLRVMNEHFVNKLVFSSSCTVYGIPDELPVTEQTPVKKANSPYGNTKKVCEEILMDISQSESRLHSIALRYFNPVGAHESAKIGELPLGVPANLVPFITQTAAGIREKLTVFGNDYDTSDGTAIRDYLHVVDLAKAHVVAVDRLMENKTGKLDIYNIGTGKGSSVLELINVFEQVTGQKPNYAFGPRRPGDVPAIYADIAKATNKLGFQTTHSLEDMMRSAWKWQLQLQES